MKLREIAKNVYYNGVNDRSKHRFEGLWPLPYGVSYNSYIVKGSEKTALIDSVADSEFITFCSNMCALGCEAPDYLIINHMEPDHSGSIPLLLEAFPTLKIVCGKPAAEMIKGFYGFDDAERFVIVKDGETLPLGDKTLRFVFTPMVHWPETIMTYLEEDKILFSGDAFGCFGALDGAFIDSDIDEIELYFSEMYRYYSNIVGKYGKFVQAALKKTGALKISHICSTHGPVWKEHIARVIDIYDRLSRYESEEGVVLVYATMYGNTSQLADAIAEALAKRGLSKIHIWNASEAEMSYMISDAFRYKTLIVGSPTYSMQIFPPVETFVRAMQTREIKNKTVATFGSFTWAAGAMPRLNEMFTEIGLPPVASMTMKQGFSAETAAEVERFADAIAEAIKG